jgi:tetratricopeptide (TPR) repeat protein
MRATMALLVFLALALGHAGDAAAQDEEDVLNERTKTDGPGTAPAAAAPQAVAPDLQALAERALELATAGSDDLPEARRLLGNLRADARFDEQPLDFRAAALRLAGFVEASQEQSAPAAALFQQAIALQDTESDVWYWLSWAQLDLGEMDAAARSVARIFRRWPEAIDTIDDDHLWRLTEPTVPEAARVELLQAMFDSGWQREALGGASHFHFQLALIRANQGDTAALRRIVPGIRDPLVVVRMLGDKRFDAVVDPEDRAFDPKAAAERQVKALQAQVRRSPDRLDVLVKLQGALLTLGRFQDVITLGEDVQAALDAAPRDAAPYKDPEDHLPWVLNQHANALDGLGRFDEAVALLESASRLEEWGEPNVNQALNLAELYASLGRADEALAASARAGSSLSDYGRMVKAMIEHRAQLARGDTAAAAKLLDYLRDNRTVAEALVLWALVEAEDLDAAAASLVAQLDSPAERADAMMLLHDLRELPAKPGEQASRANWARLRARPDVQAALARVGRIVKADVYWSE